MPGKIRPYLSIVIPAHNEAGLILPSLEKVAGFVGKQTYSSEVIVVNDGSGDNTAALVRGFVADHKNFRLVDLPKRAGKGGAVKAGMLEATGEYRLFCDADMSTPIEEITNFLKNMKDVDIAIGSRRLKGARLVRRQPWTREGMGRIYSLLVRIFILRGFLDTQCGFKMFRGEAADNIFPRQTILGFGLDVEILFIGIKRFGYKVREIPVTWNDAPNSHVRLLSDPLIMFLDLFRIRWNWWKGLYD